VLAERHAYVKNSYCTVMNIIQIQSIHNSNLRSQHNTIQNTVVSHSAHFDVRDIVDQIGDMSLSA